MNKNKTTSLPFLLIVSFSIIVMLAVVIAQYHSQNGIRQLANGNAQALITFQVDHLLDEIINDIYVLEEEAKILIPSDKPDQYDFIKRDIEKLERENVAIQQMNILDNSGKKIIQDLSVLVKQKVEPFKALQYNSPDTIKKNILTKISSEPSKNLTDSIYVTALKIQIELEKNLQNTIAENEVLSVSALSFSRLLGFVSIASIAILASIIIRRLLQNFELIKALEKAKVQAEKLSDIKEQFLANMSHEIRTPVNSVLGFSGLLEKSDLKEDQAQFVHLIKTSSQNLLNVINDILDISKIESGMFHFDMQPFNLPELCYSVEMMFYHQLSEQQLLIECNIHEDVPEIIIGDKDRLNQILINLINNAVKFTKKGTITFATSVLSKTAKTARLQFSIKDTGIGIKADKLESIFERFEQAESTTTRNYGGTGLGLSIVKKLVTMQGGNIVAKSTYGHGAEFIFDIEFKTEIPGLANKTLYPMTSGGLMHNEMTALTGIKVLAAEDNKMNQKLLAYFFQEWGLTYEFADTGSHCIEKLQHDHFDLVLMDIQMPEMDGYEASEKIRKKLNSTVPIIAMTANVLPGEREKCKNLGIDDYIAKPLNESILYDLILKNIPISVLVNKDQFPDLLINIQYLNKKFAGNPLFIKDILQQFSTQYPIELAELEKAVNERDLSLVKSLCHHMKTTISSVNVRSFMLYQLEAMESADNKTSDWDIIQHKLEMLLHFKPLIIKEADEIAYS